MIKIYDLDTTGGMTMIVCNIFRILFKIKYDDRDMLLVRAIHVDIILLDIPSLWAYSYFFLSKKAHPYNAVTNQEYYC